MTGELNHWIAQSESWRAFVDFKTETDRMSQYDFLPRSDDFYIALLGRAFDLLRAEGTSKNDMALLNTAHGLEIYSLINTRQQLNGVDHAKNCLYVGALYYLAGYPACASVIATLLPPSKDKSSIDQFISAFLKRSLNADGTSYEKSLKHYLATGQKDHIDALISSIASGLDKSAVDQPLEYVSYKIAKSLLETFSNANVWSALHNRLEDKLLDQYARNITSRRAPIWDFFSSQTFAISKGLLDNNQTVSLQMPTSAGKTAICELVVFSHIKRFPGSKALFLAPFRALASEMRGSLCKNLQSLGLKTKTLYGGSAPTSDEATVLDDLDLLVATPEKFMAMESAIPDIFKKFELIICDEGHLLDSDSRGLSYELLLAKFKTTPSERRKFVFVSAIIPNIRDIHAWLGGDASHLITSSHRPANLEFAFLTKRTNGSYTLTVNPTYELPTKYLLNFFFKDADFKFRNPNTNRLNTYSHSSNLAVSAATALKSLPLGGVALFATQKTTVMALAEEVLKQTKALSFPKPRDHANAEYISNLREYFDFLFGNEYLVTNAIEAGVLIHHGDLPQSVREKIERAIRDGKAKFVVCTNTLAEGVNLPIRTLVLHTIRRYINNQWRTIPARDIKNIVGRAGRAGKCLRGLVIATNPLEFPLLRDVINDQIPDNVHGHLSTLTRSVHDFLTEQKTTLSKEFIDAQNENFKAVIDKIDVALLDLLTDDVAAQDIKTISSNLAKSTFAFHILDKKEKQSLLNLMSIRAEELDLLRSSGDLSKIRGTGLSPRIYRKIKETIDSTDIPTSETNPLDPKVADFVFGILFSIPTLEESIISFNTINKTKITSTVLRSLILLWIDGKQFVEMSRALSLSVEVVLKLFSSVINFESHKFISSIVKILDGVTADSDRTLAPAVRRWPDYLQHGLKSPRQLELVSIGFIDRITVTAVDQWLEGRLTDGAEIEELKSLLVENQTDIAESLYDHIPFVCHEELIEILENGF